MTRTQGPAARLTIVVDERDHWHHRPLYVEIIRRAHAEDLDGATALLGIEGYAGISGIHTAHLFALGDHLPVVITIVDDQARIRAFLDTVDEILDKGVVLLDDVEVIRYRRDERHRGRR
jgi:uncharacterized protein